MRNKVAPIHTVDNAITETKRFRDDVRKIREDMLNFVEKKTLEQTMEAAYEVGILNIMLEDSINKVKEVIEKHIATGNYSDFTTMGKLQTYVPNFEEYINIKLELYRNSVALLPKEIGERLMEVDFENEDEIGRLAYYYLIIFTE